MSVCKVVETERAYSNDRRAIFLLEFAEPAAVNDARDDVSHVKRLTEVRPNNPVQLVRRI